LTILSLTLGRRSAGLHAGCASCSDCGLCGRTWVCALHDEVDEKTPAAYPLAITSYVAFPMKSVLSWQ
jgi:hypothetical protein